MEIRSRRLIPAEICFWKIRKRVLTAGKKQDKAGAFTKAENNNLYGRWPPTQIALPSSSWPVREVWYLCVCLSVCVCVCVCVMLCCVSCFYSLLLVMGGIGFTMLEPFPPKPPGQWFVQPREGGRERRRLTRRTRTRKGTIGNDGLSRL